MKIELHNPQRTCLKYEFPLNLNPYFAVVKCNSKVLGVTGFFFPDEYRLLTNHLVFPSMAKGKEEAHFKMTYYNIAKSTTW